MPHSLHCLQSHRSSTTYTPLREQHKSPREKQYLVFSDKGGGGGSKGQSRTWFQKLQQQDALMI